MNTENLIESLRALSPESMEWKFALYSVSKGRDGLELDWNLCKMEGVAEWVGTLRETLLKKTTDEKTVVEYSPFLSDKEHIAAIPADSDVIKDQISDITLNIRNGLSYAPADFSSGALPRVAGFAFYGERGGNGGSGDSGGGGNGANGGDGAGNGGGENDGVLFMRRGNPIITGQKNRLCIPGGDTLVTNEKPIFKFSPVVDFILIGGVCYFNSSAIEKDFALEDRHFAIAAKRLALIAGADVAGDFERLEKAAMSAKNARKFTGFDREILEHIARMGAVEREEFLSLYGITVDAGGRMDTSDPEQCELIIDLLCCRSVVDPLGRLATGSNITPRQ